MNPFAVAANGQSVQTATGPNKLLSITNPFTKLDTTNEVSFQTLQILFNHEPPQSPAGAPYYTNTLIYPFKHGYTYIPSIWMEWQNDSPLFPGSPGPLTSNTIFYPNGDDSAGFIADQAIGGSLISGSLVAAVQYNDGSSTTVATQAIFYATVDDVNVNLYVMKMTIETVGGSVLPLYLIGVTLNVRIYVFTEPGTTSTY